jgi:hypothetical protein
VQFQGKLFTSTFLQAAVAGPILGIDFLRKFKVIVSPELSQIQFACSAAALWTVGDIRLPGRALNFRGKHATLKSTFWQDAHICGDLHRIQLSSKNMFLTFQK